MAVTQYIVENVGSVTYIVAGVVIDAGQSRNLVEDGVTLEEIARDRSLTAGLLAGDLIGPPQTWWTTDANAGDVLVPAGVYFCSDLTAPLSLVLPPALATVQVPLPIKVYNASAQLVTLVLSPGDSAFPSSALTLSTEENVELWSTRDPSSGAWGYVVIT